jgi:lipopolysaccharide transport system permease protein
MTVEMSSHHAASSKQIILEPGRIEKNYWRDLWNYRELFEVLAWRDVSVRYKQTVMDVAWAIVCSVLSIMIFIFLFARLANLPSEGKAPYILMVLVGMLPWIFFSTALSDASNSLISNVNLISKVYFPRLIIPTATIIVGFVDLLIGFGIMAVMMFWYHFHPGWQILLLPVFVLLVFLATLGPSLWITALNVKYRDFRYAIPFMLQLGVYVSPVGFSSKVVPDKWRLLYSFNPLVGVIDGFRWCVLGGDSPLYIPGFFLSLGVIILFVWVGIVYFRRTEQSFADII